MQRTTRRAIMCALVAAAMASALTSPPSAAARTPAKPATTAPEPPMYAPPDKEAQARALDLATRALTGGQGVIERSSGDRFGAPRTVFGAGGLQFLSFPRTYRGLPVYGGEVNFMISRDGRTLHHTTTAQQAEIDVPVTPEIGERQARTIARAASGPDATVRSARLLVHVTGSAPRLAWEVVAEGRSPAGLPAEPHVFVDAAGGKVLEKQDAIKQAVGHSHYNGAPVTIGTAATETGYALRDPSRPGIECGTASAVFEGPDDEWGDGSGTDHETACVDTLFGVQRQWDMLRDWTGRNGIDGQGHGFPAKVGYNMPNATWSGSEVNMGRNLAGTKQTTPLDVVGHEYGHAVYQFSGSGGSGGPGWGAALDESTGDILGAILEHYVGHPAALDEPDYLVGEEMDLFGTGPIRNMYDPARIDGHPGCFTPTPPTDAHPGAGAQNHWFYLLAEGSNPANGNPPSPVCRGGEVRGIGIRKAAAVFVSALQLKTARWSPGEARRATVEVAYGLFGGSCKEAGAVKDAWESVGVSTQPGELIVECEVRFDLLPPAPPGTALYPGDSEWTLIRSQTDHDPAPQLSLTSSGAPAGVTVRHPPYFEVGRPVAVKIETASWAAPGNYPITFTARAIQDVKSVTYLLTILKRPPSLRMRMEPDTLRLDDELTGTATLITEAPDGPPIVVKLSSAGSGWITTAFDRTEITAGESAKVTVTVPPDVRPATGVVHVYANGPVSGSVDLSVLVPPARWRPWTRYAVDAIVAYAGQEYICVKAHTSRPGRVPPKVPALWRLL
ncbi:hypothetical protein DP939_08160 [Spongiactinospora rosea]|uniref:Zn-dependent metalloprotease n=1 Tax=Spongiactinospora rosea TaxID=2248750 RepID=A0A366M449_9ACTN|nr:M4 family metallopeptidase [Spongiactinospora rosea]RBQ21018.1 hypothetical protein DP939_08160 [Spongiactinospora rosea]